MIPIGKSTVSHHVKIGTTMIRQNIVAIIVTFQLSFS